jgi:hypothetical protein
VTYIEIEDSDGVSYRWAVPDDENVDEVLSSISRIMGHPETVKV